MNLYNPWNNIPKNKNSEILTFNSNSFPKFEIESNYLPRGLGRSYGDVCLNNDGSLILTSENNMITNFDHENGFIECESGVSINEILKIILPFGWFLPVVPGTSFVTIGGAIANDIHGKNHHKVGSFGNFVEEIDLLRSNGEVKFCSPNKNQEYFYSTIGGLGLTGLILKAKIKLIKVESSYLQTQTFRYHSLEEFFNLNEKMENHNAYTVSWVDVNFNKNNIRGVYHVGNHDKEDKRIFNKSKSNKEINLRLPFPPYISLVNNFTIKILNNGYYFLNRNSNLTSQYYKKFFFPLDALRNWNKAYGRKGFYQYQFVVKKSFAYEVIEEVIKILKMYNQKPVLGVLKTFGKVKSVGMLSFPTEGVTLAIDIQNKGIKTLKMLDDLDSVITSCGGRVYPAKDSRMSYSTFLTSFQKFEKFENYIDPLFNSSFLSRMRKN